MALIVITADRKGRSGVVLAMIELAAAAILTCRDPYRIQKLFMLGMGLIFAFSGMYRVRAALQTHIEVQRYFYIACVFSLWFICCWRFARPCDASLAVVAIMEMALLPKIANTS
jgi:hypothetical protein